MEFVQGILVIIAFVAPVAYFVYHVFAVGFIVFNEKDDSGKAIAWILVAILLPLVGFIAYLLLGLDWRGRKAYKKRITDRSPSHTGKPRLDPEGDVRTDDLTPRETLLLNMVTASQPLPASYDNKAQLFFNGEHKFAALKKDIEAAQHHIHLEYFIWQKDELGNELRELLFKKVKEGVEVRVLMDRAGSKTSSRKYLKELRDQGMPTYFFHPTSKADMTHINHRCHRKNAIIDGRIGYTGGYNVGDEYVNKGPLGFWRDTHVRFEGTAAHDLQSIFLSDWYFATGEDITDTKYFPANAGQGDLIVQVCPSGLDVPRPAILFTYFQLIKSATRTLRIWTPYFMPEPGLLTALQTAALSGVDVKLITPGVFDKPPVQWVGQSYMPELMEMGAEFYEYEDGFVHAKAISADDDLAVVGSANFDHRSMKMDFELTAAMVGGDIATQLNEQFEKDLTHCRKVEPADFANRSFLTRLKEAVSRVASPMY
jgi:cardiolipin synthase